jgi:tryptophan synthase alpha chain
LDALLPAGIDPIFLVAPTSTEERLRAVAARARGFVYCVSLTGVTGARRELAADVGAFVARVRRHTSLPIVVGFGVSTPSHVAGLRGVADGVAVGSAALDAVAAAPEALRAEALRDFVGSLAAAGKA